MIVTVTPNPVVDRTLTVPRIVMDDMVRATEVREDWGGKGFNVSRALQSFGQESVAMGFLGGAAGAKLASGLRAHGIQLTVVPIAEETRTNIVITEADAKRYVKVNEAGPTISCEEQMVFFEHVDSLVQAGDIWALCGSLPPGLPHDFYAQLTERLHHAGARVLLDTSGEAFRTGLSACPDLIKPNDVEAAAFLGEAIAGPEQAARAVDKFVDMGITFVALSLGGAGLMLASGSSRIWAKPPSVHAQNPVGAGDALVAGIVWAFAQGLSLDEVARWGVASGTAAAVHEGVSVGTRSEIEALHAQVRFATWPEDL
ncbi:MAG: 1-phosphofructokinase [Anaerolineae bacterium]|nr:1-phosphofructokinase [Anaerolineae bacterium]